MELYSFADEPRYFQIKWIQEVFPVPRPSCQMTSSTFFPETNSTSDIFHPQYTRRQRRRRRRRKLPNTSQALADKKTSSRLEGSRRTTRTKFHYDQRSPSAGATIGHCSLRPQQERSNSLKGAAARFLWDRLASANLGGNLPPANIFGNG